MTKQEVLREIDNASSMSPYAASLRDALANMKTHQLDYFCEQVAPYYLRGDGKDSYGMMYKDMEYMSRAVARDKDVSSILGVDYRQIGSMVESLPALQMNQSITFQEKSDAERISNINQLIDKYVTHVDGPNIGLSNKTFCQSANVNPTELPVQGWKFHISANNLQDYEHLMEKLCPEFDALGVAFKVVRPEQLDAQTASSQIGKAITIYPTPAFDFNRLSPQLQSMLSQDGV
jgi:hypothetical protein